MTDRPKALVTAPFRGEGLDTLRELCSDVVLDPWIDHRPLRLYSAEQLAERIEAEGANLLDRRERLGQGPGARPAPHRDRLVPGRPDQRRHPRRDREGHPGAARARPQRRRRRRADRRPHPRGEPRHRAADRDVREGQVWRDGTIPYQRFRAWQIAGRTVGIVGFGAVGRATAWRLEGLGMQRDLLRPVRPGRHPLARGSARRGGRRVDARGGHARDREPHRARAVPADEGRRDLHQLGPRAAARHRRARRTRCKAGEIAGAGLDHFVGENLPPDHPLCSMDNVVLTPHIGGAT